MDSYNNFQEDNTPEYHQGDKNRITDICIDDATDRRITVESEQMFRCDSISESLSDSDEPLNIEMYHVQLEKHSSVKTKATNWSLQIEADCGLLEKIKYQILENANFIAVRGQIKIKSDDLPTLNCLLKYKNPTYKTALLKQISNFQPIDNKKISMYAVVQSEHVEHLLKIIDGEKNKKIIFQKGNYTYSRQSKKLNPQANELISKYGISIAREIWAKEKRFYRDFEKAEQQYRWEESVLCKKTLREEAEKRLEDLFPWQEYVYKIFLSKPDDRTIYVVLDQNGGNGKTFLQNMITDMHPDDVVDVKTGKTEDMTKLVQQKGNVKLLQINLSRPRNGNLNLAAIEDMKDGNFSSMKYASKSIRIQSPHVFIYTNKELKWKLMTTDRWKIIHLEKKYDQGFKIFTWLEWSDLKKSENENRKLMPIDLWKITHLDKE